MKLLCLPTLLLTLALIASADDKPTPLVVGHRGLFQTMPEDTLAGFRGCLEAGIALELDVRRTKDGHLVVLHDDTLDRTTNGTGKVSEKSLAEVRALDAGKKFRAEFAGEKIPLLAEVFALVKKYPRPAIAVAVDLKINDGQVEAEVVKLAKEAGVLDRLLFIGTSIENTDVRKRLRAADAGTSVARLAPKPEDLAATIDDKTCNWAYLRFLPSREQVDSLHKANKKVILVGQLFMKKELENWKKGHEAGADAILTDFPLELNESLKPNGKQ